MFYCSFQGTHNGINDVFSFCSVLLKSDLVLLNVLAERASCSKTPVKLERITSGNDEAGSDAASNLETSSVAERNLWSMMT